MTAGRPRPPDPTGVRTVADFVASLVRLKRWAGEPSLSRLRALGGQVPAPDGTLVDALPKSTMSYVLRRTDKLPRSDFVKAFVTACLRHCDYPAELILEELDRWRAARNAVAGPSDRTASPSVGAARSGPPVTTRSPTGAVRAVVATVPGPAAPVPDVVPGTPELGGIAGRAEPDGAAELLARRVAREEDRARKGLLGGYNIAPISFGPARIHNGRGDGGDGGGEVFDDLRSIGRFFGGLHPQRLLVVGESGAGKTVLAIELVLQMVEPIVDPMKPAGTRLARPMVPVRLNAARWTPGSPFERWLGEQLVRDFGLGATDAARLVRDRQVLPVLDGLDEMDPEPATGPPRRAIGLLAELNRYSDLSGRRPGAAVVTCRADRHRQLVDARVGLDEAAHIQLHDLSAGQIGAYLRARWPDHHPCAPHRDGILAALSGSSREAVHPALRTPWRLSLTATAVESGADPAELLHVAAAADPAKAAAAIGRRLLDAYVPAATALAPRTAQGVPYRPEQVRSWLVRVADHLHWQAAHAAELDRPPAGLTAIDIVPHLLWPIAGRRLVRALHGLCCATVAAVAMLAFWIGSGLGRLAGPTRDNPLTLVLVLGLMAGWVAIAAGLALSPWPAAAGGRANVPRGRRVIGGLLGALAGCPVGVLGGLGGHVLTEGRVFDPVFATAAGAVGGSVFGALVGLTAAGRQRGEYMAVSEAIRAEPLTLLGFGLCGTLTGLPPLRLAGAGPAALAVGLAGAFGLAFALGVIFKIATGGWSKDAELAHPREALRRNPIIGVAFGLIGGIAATFVFVMNNGIVTSLACALVGGITFGLAFGAVTWSRAMIGLIVAAARGLLPLRLWTFLDWACEARLLRISGATYQFRHRELQDFLASADD